MEVKAKARFLRISPKKVRLVIDVLRGMKVVEALEQLKYSKKHAKEPVLKLLGSAIANAENNFNLKKENLFIKKITADGGPIIHRWRPRALGRSAEIRKRTTHLTVVLDELAPIEAKTVKGKKTEKITPKKINKKKKR